MFQDSTQRSTRAVAQVAPALAQLAHQQQQQPMGMEMTGRTGDARLSATEARQILNL